MITWFAVNYQLELTPCIFQRPFYIMFCSIPFRKIDVQSSHRRTRAYHPSFFAILEHLSSLAYSSFPLKTKTGKLELYREACAVGSNTFEFMQQRGVCSHCNLNQAVAKREWDGFRSTKSCCRKLVCTQMTCNDCKIIQWCSIQNIDFKFCAASYLC